MNKLVFCDEATFHLSNLTPMDFFLWGFCEVQSVRVLLPTTLHELKTRIRGLCKHLSGILHNVWQETEYRFDVARATRGAHIELY
jgi:hypothetical protein